MKTHLIQWTKEKTAFFWQNMQSLIEKNKYSDRYENIIKIIKKYIPTIETAIDYGSGTGYLAKELNGIGIKCLETDIINPQIIMEKADIVFLIEVIEHIPIQDIKNTLKVRKTLHAT